MPTPTDRINLDISYADFDYAITACLERCETEADCARLVDEILRVMKIRQRKDQQKQAKLASIAKPRQYRWKNTHAKAINLPVHTRFSLKGIVYRLINKTRTQGQ